MLARLKIIKEKTKNKYKKSIVAIPSILTFLNAICGFLSIIKALEGKFTFAACYIILAVILDGLDGRIARRLSLSTEFGSELDSLCDAISFCLAPVILIYCWYPDNLGFLAKLSLVSYLCAGLGRLAKFNVTSKDQYKYFIGLPTTLAAFSVTSLILSYKWLSQNLWGIILTKQILFSLVFILAIFMISPIKFYSFKSYKLIYPADYIKLLLALITLVLLFIKGYPILFFAVVFYIVGNIVISCLH